jgi:hypothetical protein
MDVRGLGAQRSAAKMARAVVTTHVGHGHLKLEAKVRVLWVNASDHAITQSGFQRSDVSTVQSSMAFRDLSVAKRASDVDFWVNDGVDEKGNLCRVGGKRESNKALQVPCGTCLLVHGIQTKRGVERRLVVRHSWS